MRATFKGGYTIAFYKADVTTGEAQETWHNQPNDALVRQPRRTSALAGDLVIFQFSPGGGRGGEADAAGEDAAPAAPEPPAAPAAEALAVDEWDRYYSLNITDPSARPVLLTTTDGLIENQTSIALSADGKTFYYCTNAKDIERRHIWAVRRERRHAGRRSRQATESRHTRLRSRPASTWRR